MRRLYYVGRVFMRDMERSDFFKHACAMAYSSLLSLVPALAVVFSVVSLFRPLLGENSATIEALKQYILRHLATGSGQMVVEYLESFLGNLDITKIGLTNFAVLVVLVGLLLRQIEGALNRIWLVERSRNAVKRFIYFWTFLTFGTFALSVGVGVISKIQFIDVPVPDGEGSAIFSFLGEFLAAFAFFGALYKFVPNCRVRFKEAAIGGVVSTILLLCAISGFRYYAQNLNSYENIYGALAAIPLFLTWLYIIWMIILFGALVAWRVQQGISERDLMEGAHIAPMDRYRNYQLRSMTPLLCTVAIYQRFASGAGSGMLGVDISAALNLPAEWVAESLLILDDRGIIIARSNPKLDDEGDAMAMEFFPAKPAEHLHLREIFENLTAATVRWFERWHNELALEATDGMRFFVRSVLDNPGATVSDLMQQLHGEPTVSSRG